MAGTSEHLPGEHRWIIAKDVLASHLTGEVVILHTGTKEFFHLNETAAEIWRCVERGHPIKKIVSQLVTRFDVTEDDAHRELLRVTAELQVSNLLE